jgi:hypothetical protein
MESQGADVIGYELSDEGPWDLVPFPGRDLEAAASSARETLRRIHNSFWLAHRAHRSDVKVVYGRPYEIPAAIGPVDIAVYGAVLLHTRDPFLALQNGSRLAREAVVVTEPASLPKRIALNMVSRLGRPLMAFQPTPHQRGTDDVWWTFVPDTIRAFVELLGFTKTTVSHHTQAHRGRKRAFFTVVGQRPTGRA